MLNRTSPVDAFYHQRFTLGGSAFTATLFSKPHNWSLSQLSHPDEQVRAQFGDRVGRALHDLHVGKALAPSPVKFTDRIIESADLTTRVPVGSYMLYRNPDRPADGVPIQSGEACVISPSSCPTALMIRGGRALVLHTGRDCLVDRYALQHNDAPSPERKHASICFSALHYLGKPQDVRVKVFWGVPAHLFPHDFNHPTYGAVNRKLYDAISTTWDEDAVPKRGDRFFLDLPRLIKAQCTVMGVPEGHIDLTYAYQPLQGTWLDGAPGTSRNLAVIARHS